LQGLQVPSAVICQSSGDDGNDFTPPGAGESKNTNDTNGFVNLSLKSRSLHFVQPIEQRWGKFPQNGGMKLLRLIERVGREMAWGKSCAISAQDDFRILITSLRMFKIIVHENLADAQRHSRRHRPQVHSVADRAGASTPAFLQPLTLRIYAALGGGFHTRWQLKMR
jgi:hypothetical protein